ncbi:hypothetical protein V6N13_047349 [Hibiscus sabdariffa]
MLAENTAPNPQLSTCQLCGKYGHDAKRCWSYIVTQDQQEQAIANMIQKALKQQSWVTNSGANTHVANDVTTLNAYNDYGDELIMADGDEKEFINDLVEIEMIEGKKDCDVVFFDNLSNAKDILPYSNNVELSCGKQATSGGVLLMNIGETRAFFTEHDGETRAIFTGSSIRYSVLGACQRNYRGSTPWLVVASRPVMRKLVIAMAARLVSMFYSDMIVL